VTRKGKVDAGIFPSAYHIKVAVRDGKDFWLSSGNWQSSNQPAIDPLGPDRGLSNVHTMYNREWHVIVEEQTLAQTYEDFIKYDEKQAKPLNVGPQTAIRPDLFVPEELLAQAAADKYFAPRDVNIGAGEVVQPLLTPDNYADNVLPLIRAPNARSISRTSTSRSAPTTRRTRRNSQPSWTPCTRRSTTASMYGSYCATSATRGPCSRP
jgi:hypothetical protein